MFQDIKLKLKIIKINIKNTYQIQTAYYGENWFSLGSTLFYTLTLYLFITIIYSNVKQVAGYTRDEMLFLLLLTQIGYYSDWIWSSNNISKLMDSVYAGELDIILTKPIPSLFF